TRWPRDWSSDVCSSDLNNVWGGYDDMVEDGVFTWPKPFWEQPMWRWDAMFGAGVRAHYLASRLAAPAMIARQRGLIVNISTWARSEERRVGKAWRAWWP